ncbi:MAG: hypothetical protein IPM91_20390 [Bacteroidetes bacterium]|nr:hypothetical protein [Bacteroidota bacterium]
MRSKATVCITEIGCENVTGIVGSRSNEGNRNGIIRTKWSECSGPINGGRRNASPTAKLLKE